jgi:two-component system, NarL family, sensor histidine kinase UhpB
MSELRSPYVSVSQSSYAQARASYKPALKTNPKKVRHSNLFSRLSLFQRIFLSTLSIVLAGAVVGSWLTAHLAEAGQFNLVSYTVIIIAAVLVSGIVSFFILKKAFRPFVDLQQILSKVHTGNPRARLSLERINDPDVRQFIVALNLMLSRLEQNARVIQEDQRQLQLMTAQVINAQENERKRIARELHDEASQSLTAMIMGLEAARRAAPARDANLQKQLVGLKDMAVATLEELRKLALDLRPTMLDDLGLIPALRWLSRTASERSNLEMQLTLSDFDEQDRLNPELETCLFRITQECLTNIVKHAQATVVQINLERVPPDADVAFERVRLTVEDNGRGFDCAEARAKAYHDGHLGLFDIEERAALLGGTVKVTKANPLSDKPGVRTTVFLPLDGCRVDHTWELNTNAPPYITDF